MLETATTNISPKRDNIHRNDKEKVIGQDGHKSYRHTIMWGLVVYVNVKLKKNTRNYIFRTYQNIIGTLVKYIPTLILFA